MPGLEIVDGTGNGYSAEVTSRNHLVVESVTEDNIKRNNHRLGQVWSIDIPGITATGSGDIFFYLENTGNADLSVTDIYLSCSAVTTIQVHSVSGTPSYSSASDATLTPRNLGSTKTPTATIKTDVDITGLTSEGVLHYIQIPVAGTEYSFKGRAAIVIPKGKALALVRSASSGAVEGTITLVQEYATSQDSF